MAKIVITDIDFPETGPEQRMCEEAGVELAVFQARSPEDIIRNAADADAALTSYGQYTRAVFESLPRLRCVSRTGIGYDSIDVEAATENGVGVCVVPGYGTEVVSDHAIALTLACLRRINEMDAHMKAGEWGFAYAMPLGQAYGRVFGIVGMGEIGRAVARKAAGLGFKVICTSRSLKPGRRTPEGFDIVSLEELLATADVVSFNTALTPQTHHILDAAAIATMKPTAVVVNTARGGIVDTIALAQALEEGRLWGAGIDVFEEEPVDPNHPLLKAPHTVLTPHAAYWSEESAAELRRRAMQAAIDAVQGRVPLDCLNPQVFS